MAWWSSEDGRGYVGDRPADILGTVLTESLGDRFDTDLFAGFLSALGAAWLRHPEGLVSDVADPRTQALCAEFRERPSVTVAVRPAATETALEDAVFEALEAVAFQYRVADIGRPPTLAELLETLAFVARGRIVDAETGEPATLRAIRAVPADQSAAS